MPPTEELCIRRSADPRVPPVTVDVPLRFALYWDILFGPLSLEEAIQLIAIIMVPGEWTSDRLAEQRCALAQITGEATQEYDLFFLVTALHARTKHHIVPKARGGKIPGNIVKLPNGWHIAWHKVFDLCMPAEAQSLLNRVMVTNTMTSEEAAKELTRFYREADDEQELLQRTG